MIVTAHLLCGRWCRVVAFLYNDNTTALNRLGLGACSPRKILKK